MTEAHRTGHRRSVLCGAGVGSLRLDVIQRPCPWSPDFPPVERLDERAPVSPQRAAISIRARTGVFKTHRPLELLRPVQNIQA